MTQVTVKELAQTVGTPIERLLQQMKEAGLPHSKASDAVSDAEKQKLLAHLSAEPGDKPDSGKKITLQRKTTTTLRAPGSKTISVEVRKKRTYVKRPADESPVAKVEVEVKQAAPAKPAAEPVKQKSTADIIQDAEVRRIEAVEQARQAKEAEAKAAREKEEQSAQPE